MSVRSGSQSPDIVVWVDDGQPVADTATERYTGSDVFDAANKAIEARLTEFSRPGGQFETDGPGSIDLLIKPGVYEVSTPLRVRGDDGDYAKGIEHFTLRGTNLYTYIRTAGIDGSDHPYAVDIDPNLDSDTFEQADRNRGIEIRNLFFDNGDEKTIFEGQSDSHSRDKGAINIAHAVRIDIDNVEVRYYEQGLRLENVWEGEVSQYRCTSCGDAANDVSANIVTRANPVFTNSDGSDDVARSAANHIKFDNIRGGYGCEHAFFEFTEYVQKCAVEYPTPELDCRGFLLKNNSLVVSNANVSGNGPHFDVRRGDVSINGGRFKADDEFLRVSVSGNRADVSVDNAYVIAPPDADAIEVYDGALALSNTDIEGGLRGVEAGESNTTYAGSGDPNPYQIRISDCKIENCRADGIWLNRNNRKYDWHVSDTEVNDVCANGSGNVITLGANGAGKYKVSNCSLGADSGVSSKVGVKDMGYIDRLSVRDCFGVESANLSAVTDRPQPNSTAMENSGTATIEPGSMVVAVTHQLAEAPTAEDITATPTSSLGSASEWYLNAIDQSAFEIAVDADPEQPVTVSWQAAL